LLNHSKWLNQALVKTTDPSAMAKINGFSFVKNISPVAQKAGTGAADTMKINVDQQAGFLRKESVTSDDQNNLSTNGESILGNALNYGNSYAQIHVHEGEYLHNLGFRGQGLVIALLDAGFRSYLTNPAFDSIRQNSQVWGSYDYVNLKTSVNEEDIHGAYCLSIIAANEPGRMTGSATGATFWLLKTEDTQSEYPVEEQNWAAAAEFADSAGADIISTSLGYAYFDDPSFNHQYSDRDGHHAVISIAANVAVGRGMIVTASAGNSGDAPDERKYVDCPADADSVLTIGAIDSKGAIASFSSWGPNAAGQIKPDVVSVGQGTVVAAASGAPMLGDGTSFSNPNLAGLIACLWQAFPEFNSHDIRRAVVESADRYTHPDDRYGYGIPNFRVAYQHLLDQRNFLAYVNRSGPSWISVYPVPFRDNFSVVFKPAFSGTATLRLIDAFGRTLESKSVPVTANQFSLERFSKTYLLPKGIYFIRYDDGHQKKTLKTIRQ
jgi:serine protease AprX